MSVMTGVFHARGVAMDVDVIDDDGETAADRAMATVKSEGLVGTAAMDRFVEVYGAMATVEGDRPVADGDGLPPDVDAAVAKVAHDEVVAAGLVGRAAEDEFIRIYGQKAAAVRKAGV